MVIEEHSLRIVTKGNTRSITLGVGFIRLVQSSRIFLTELKPSFIVYYPFYTNLRILAFRLTITSNGGRVGTRLYLQRSPNEFFLFGCQL